MLLRVSRKYSTFSSSTSFQRVCRHGFSTKNMKSQNQDTPKISQNEMTGVDVQITEEEKKLYDGLDPELRDILAKPGDNNQEVFQYLRGASREQLSQLVNSDWFKKTLGKSGKDWSREMMSMWNDYDSEFLEGLKMRDFYEHEEPEDSMNDFDQEFLNTQTYDSIDNIPAMNDPKISSSRFQSLDPMMLNVSPRVKLTEE
eukprot:TRINITY_DN2067_c0_g1_i1.p2 TRINITY_DN2067_c0_g1~~TRINITY_DN2067_c0_g1_i1.p2  ORF type:complete len:200 (-),score=42.47 TRINITY_DN2067_c0_g1_i1:1161-1760(-)